MEAVQSAMGLGVVLQFKDMASDQFGKVRSEMVQTRQAGDNLVKSFDANMTKLAMGIGMVATGAGIIKAAFVEPMSMAINSQYKMSEVNTLLGRNQEALMARLGNQANEMSIKFGKSGAEMSEAMYGLISAGTDAEKVGGVLEVTGKLAIGGITDMATASNGLTSLMNAFSVSAENAESVADSMFIAMKRGKTTIAELSNSIGQVAPIASKAGMSVDDMLGAIATATLAGLGTAESSTGLRATLNAILQPSEQAKKMAESLGIQFNEQALKAKGLRGVLEDVMKATGGSADEIGALLGSVEAFGFASNVMKNDGSIWTSIMDDMAKKSGAADEAFSIVSDTWLHKWNVIKQTFIVGIKRFGAIFMPIMGIILTPIALLVKGFAEMPKPILTIIGVMIAFGSIMLISRGLIFAHAAVMKLWAAGARNHFIASALNSKKVLFGLNMQFLKSTMYMTGQIAAIYLLYKAYQSNFLGIKTAVSWISAAWDVAMSATSDGTAKIRKSVLKGLGFENLEEGAQVIGRIASVFFRLKEFVSEFASGFKNEFQYVLDTLDKFGESILGLGNNAFTDMLKSLLDIDKSSLQTWKDWGKTIGMVIFYIVAIGAPILIVVKAFALLMALVSGIATVFSIAGAAISFMLSPIGLLIAAGILLYCYWDQVRSFFTMLWESPIAMMLMFITGPVGWLIALATAIIANWDAVKAWFVLLWNDPGAAVDQFKDLVKSKLGEVCNWVMDKWQGLKDFLSHPIDAVVNFIKGGDQDAATAASGKIPGHATGGVFTSPHLAWVCENGPEAIIPLSGDNSQAMSIWQQAGQMLGMFNPMGQDGAATEHSMPTTKSLLTERFVNTHETSSIERVSEGKSNPTIIENKVYLDGEQVYSSIKKHDRYDRLRNGDDSAE